jgi:cyclopropane fatty-acyl-phospholipid synthase-like methyltransferase
MNFDYIFSHSILSHAAHWQLDQYLENSKRVLAPNGVMLASIRLAEGNSYGSGGSPNKSDSMDK